MTIRTFWHLIIKSMGIWIVIHGIMSLPGMITQFLVTYNTAYLSKTEFIFTELFYFVVPILFYLLVLRFLVLKTQGIINLLKLEKGFEETRIDMALPFNKVLRIIIILMGGFLFVSAIPVLIETIYSFLKEDRIFSDSPRSLAIITNAVQTIVGFLIMTNSDIVLRYINKKSGESETKQLDKEEF